MKNLRDRKIDLVGKLTPRFEEEDLDYILRSYLEEFMEKEKELPGGFSFGFVDAEWIGREIVSSSKELLVDKNSVRITKYGNVQNFHEIVSMIDFLEKYVVGNENAGSVPPDYVPSARMQEVFDKLDEEDVKNIKSFYKKNQEEFNKTRALYVEETENYVPGPAATIAEFCGAFYLIEKVNQQEFYEIEFLDYFYRTKCGEYVSAGEKGNQIGLELYKIIATRNLDKSIFPVFITEFLSTNTLVGKEVKFTVLDNNIYVWEKGANTVLSNHTENITSSGPVEKIPEPTDVQECDKCLDESGTMEELEKEFNEPRDLYGKKLNEVTGPSDVEEDEVFRVRHDLHEKAFEKVPGPSVTVACWAGALYLIEKTTEERLVAENESHFFYYEDEEFFLRKLKEISEYKNCDLYKIIACRDIEPITSQKHCFILPKKHLFILDGIVKYPYTYFLKKEVKYTYYEETNAYHVWIVNPWEGMVVEDTPEIRAFGKKLSEDADRAWSQRLANKDHQAKVEEGLIEKKPAIDNPETPGEGLKILEGRINFCDIDLDNSYILCNTERDIENVLACYNPNNQIKENVGIHALFRTDFFMFIDHYRVTSWWYGYTTDQGIIPDIRKSRVGIRTENIDWVTEKQKS